nr:MAG TPA: hypothetical protein [Caudoviricetes sp.]
MINGLSARVAGSEPATAANYKTIKRMNYET